MVLKGEAGVRLWSGRKKYNSIALGGRRVCFFIER